MRGDSLWRREAHRTLSIVLLVGSCLFLLSFGRPTVRFAQGLLGQNEDADYLPVPSRRQARGVSIVTIPNALLRHFQEQGIVLKPAPDGDRDAEWIFDNADVGARCEVVTSFVRFQKGMTGERKKAHLQTISTPSVINENTDLAMFHPHARGTTSATTDCEKWPGKSAEIIEKLLDAFTSYQAKTIAVRVNPVK